MGNFVSTVSAVVLTAFTLAACADTADPPATTLPATTVAPTTTAPPEPPTTTTTTPPTTTLAPTTNTTLAPTTTTTLTPTTTSTTAVAAPPPTAAISHGQLAWAVYLGLWDEAPDEAARAEAAAPATAVGYEVEGWGDVGCDQGAAEALGVDPSGGHFASGLYFATEADAEAAAALIGDGVLAVAEVQTFCLD